MAEIQRISQNDYLPTDAGILKLGGVTPAKSGIQEHKFVMGECSLQMVDISSTLDVSSISHHTSVPLLRRKWISQIEHTISIAFFVDLSKYDHDPEALLEEFGQTRMVEPLGLFDVVVNSRWFAHTSIILLLCNVGHFGEKLKTRPLRNYFPDYTGGNDVIEASGYLLTWFYPLNRANLKTYSHICEPSNESVMRIVWTSVKGTLRNAKNSSVR
jgi:guanine nucleotide-binding protein G(i) subunit alpha